MLSIASSANETRSIIHDQLPAGGHHIVSQNVAGAVVASHLEIAVVGREPRIQHLGNLNWPAAEREPARRQPPRWPAEHSTCTENSSSWLMRGASLFRSPRVRDDGPAAKRFVAEGQLPILGDDELGTVQELDAMDERAGKLGSVEHRLEEVRPFQMSTRQVCAAARGPPQIGAPEIRPRKIEATEIEPAEDRTGQVRPLIVLRPPRIPCRCTASEQSEILIPCHF